MANKKEVLELIENIEEELLSIKKSIVKDNCLIEDKTVSYQLGNILLSNIKSVRGIFSLPRELFRLYKSIKYRKNDIKKNDDRKFIDVSRDRTNESSQNKTFYKALTLLDPISEVCWKDTFVGFPLSRAEFEKQIANTTSQFAFFESAWQANKKSWIYAFTSPNLQHRNAQDLLRVIGLLKDKNIPIVFWNKEDPMHYELFKPIARLADYIFTTDELVVSKYKTELNNDNVYSLPFAAPVKITNPLNRFNLDTETVCFAGTYYAKNHPDRKKQMDMILPALLDYNGIIYDRVSKPDNDDYKYPDIYTDIIRGAVDFSEMTTVYKKFKVFLNVNTIRNSTTMMSRRVYELLASGTPVVSTPSKAITEQFPGIVVTVNSEQETKSAVKKLLEDSYYWHKQSVLGIRAVLAEHTYEMRWNYIKSILENNLIAISTPKICIVVLYYGYQPLDIYILSLLKQKHVDIHKIVLIKSDKTIVDDSIVSQYNIEIKSLKDFKFNQLSVNETDYTFVTTDKSYNYAYSVWGMLLSFKYSNSSIVAKSSYFKLSSVAKKFSFNIDKNNWYVFMKETEIFSALIKNDKIKNVKVDFLNGKIKILNDKKDILLIDPFNVISIDQPNLIKNHQWLKDFIYKTNPYLGI